MIRWCVDETEAVLLLPHFVAVGDFESGPARDHVGHVHDVGVTKAEVPEHLAIGPERNRAQDDFVAPVAIKVGDRHGVAALAANLRRFLVAVPAPEFFKIAVLEIVRVDDHPRVGAAAHEKAEGLAVERGEADLVAVDAIAGLSPQSRWSPRSTQSTW